PLRRSGAEERDEDQEADGEPESAPNERPAACVGMGEHRPVCCYQLWGLQFDVAAYRRVTADQWRRSRSGPSFAPRSLPNGGGSRVMTSFAPRTGTYRKTCSD